MERSIRLLITSLFLMTALVAGVRFMSAQEFRSTLTGRVTDPSGAVIPGALVTAVKNDTHQTYTAKSDNSGDYYIPYVLPGLYTVTVEAKGFKKNVQGNVLLQASESYGLNFKLQVGATTQSVTVTAAPPLINTASGSSGTILTGRAIESLPLNGRQVYMLIGTTPGSQFLQTQFGASGYSGTRGWDVSNNYSLAGGVQGYNMFTLNGTNITMMGGFGEEGSWMTAPNIDAVQEVNVMTNTYDARYGNTAGGTVNMVTKSGTNQYHGDIYEYLENGALNANTFERNYSGIPRQNTIQHQYGGTFGGPIKKDKIFFFGSFEGYWENIPFSTLTSVPTPAERQGNFSQSGYTVYDPTTTVCNSGGTLDNCPNNDYSRTEFANDAIPTGEITQAGQAFVNLFPLPNINQGSVNNNYIATTPDTYRYYQPMVRVDYNTSDKTRWYSFYEWQKGHEYRNSSGFTGPAENGDINSMRTNTIATEDMTHVFSPTLVGDFKLSFTRYFQSFPNGPLSTPTPSSIGLNMPYVGTASKDLLPQVTFGELYPQIVGNAVTTQMNQTLALNVDFTKIHGAHSFEFGGEIDRWNFADPNSVGNPNGTFSFGTQPTQYNPTQRNTLTGINDGNVIASLLLGYPTGGSVNWNSTVYETIPDYAIYGQDNWRVTHRLTLNIGLRYSVEGGVVDRFNGLNRGMCTTCINPITNNSTYQANIANSTNIAAWQAAYSALGVNDPKLSNVYGGIQFTGAYGQPRNAYNVDWSNIAPRLGFAYQINDKTVIRGGWGWMFAYGIEGGTSSGYSIATPYNYTLNGGVTPTNYFQTGTPYPDGAERPVGSSLGLETNLGNQQSLDFPQRKIPRSTIMSIGIERQLPRHTVLSVKYSGNYARALRTQGVFTWVNGSLPLTFGYPQLQQNTYYANNGQGAALAGELGAQVPNPYYGVVPPGSSLGSSKTVQAVRLLVPLSQFGLVGNYTNPYGKSWYDSLQVKVNKRLYGATRGLTYQLSYTYSKNMILNTYRNGWPWQDPSPIYEPVGYDRTNVFSLSGEWDLPFGKGARYFLTNPSRPVGALVNGWRLSGILSDETGFPQGMPGGWHTSTHSLVPDGGPTIAQWLYNCNGDPRACYTSVPAWGQGNQPDRVGYLRQPHIANLDLSLQKNFHLTESKRLQFRADALNLTNTPLFGGPDTNPNDTIKQVDGRWQGFGTINLFQQNFPRIIQLSLKLYF